MGVEEMVATQMVRTVQEDYGRGFGWAIIDHTHIIPVIDTGLLVFLFVLHIELIQIKNSEKFTFVIIIWWCSHQPTTIATVAWAVSTLFLVIEYANVNLSVNVSNLYGNVCLSIDFPLGSQCPTHPTSSHNHCLVPTLFCFCLLLFVFLGNLAILYCP